MRTLTTLLALFAFSLHLLLGCCWHHAHGAEELLGHQHEASGHHVHLPLCCSHSHSHSDGHEHSHGSPEHPQSDEAPTPHAPCSDPQCVFLLSSPLQIDSEQQLTLPIAAIDLQLQAADFRASIYDLAEDEQKPPHLRRHLALSRLLN